MTPERPEPPHRGARALDHESCYRAVHGRDRRFDGVFYTAVRTTGIYCRPSCPARTPARGNVSFHRTAAAAQAAGYRACKRCLPDATPGSPEWDLQADAAGRAMRLIADGVVDREGVPGLAARLGYSERHLHRILVAELGAPALALARARRAQTARTLIETTTLPLTRVAYAAGFSSVRQFNETILEVYGATPTALRGKRSRESGPAEAVSVRLAVRRPFAGMALGRFLAARAVAGVETCHLQDGGWRYSRTIRLPHGPGALSVLLRDEPRAAGPASVPATFWLCDLADLSAAIERTRRLLDADADPVAVDEALCDDPLLGPLVTGTPGLRVPGQVDGDEVAVRAVVGQQVSVASARTTLARLTASHGEPVTLAVPGLTHLFPGASVLATLDPSTLAMPQSRGRALTSLCRDLADGRISLDRSLSRDETQARLRGIPGIGPWTAGYIAMRTLGDPDVFLPTDVGVRHALGGRRADPEQWRPWRSYALMHLWHSLTPDPTET